MKTVSVIPKPSGTIMLKPTLQEIRAIKNGDLNGYAGVLLERFLPWLIMVTEIDLLQEPVDEQRRIRWEKFKEQLIEKQWMFNGTGI